MIVNRCLKIIAQTLLPLLQRDFRLWFLVFIISVGFNLVSGQYYFSKNKVQYQDFQFKILSTTHFNIYFYEGGEGLAEYASKYAEDFYQKIASALKTEIKNKIPLIIYNSPNEFGQTNIILDIIEESVGGFSELFKNRVVVPFNGSYRDFRIVLEHEITHIFEFELFYKPRLASIFTLVSDFQIPLWVAEGISEFLSSEEKPEVFSEVYLRDLMLNNQFVSLDKLNDAMGYINYRIGEAFFRYVNEVYGRQKIFEFIHSLKAKRNLESAFKESFGISVSKMSQKLEDYLKIKYWPLIAQKDNFSIATVLTNHTAEGAIYNTAPVISPSGTKIAFISDRNGYTDVYVISAIDGKIIKHLVKGERSGGFENVSVLRGGLAWSSDEREIVLVARSQGKDNIVIVDYPSGKVKKRLSYHLDGIYSPKFSPDNQKVVFVGLKNGYADIYTTDLTNGKLTRITYDYYEDRDPYFSPDGKEIVFVSDRPEADDWIPGNYGIFKTTANSLNAEGTLSLKRIRNVKRARYLAHPIFSSDGKYIIYTAEDQNLAEEKSGSANIALFIYSLTDQTLTHKTEFISSSHYPSISQNDSVLAFSYYTNQGWDVCVIREPFSQIPRLKPIVPPIDIVAMTKSTDVYQATGIDYNKVSSYQFTLTPDYGIGSAGYSTQGGFSGNVELVLSDVLGNHRFFLQTELYKDIANSNIFCYYWNLTKRTDWGLGLIQYFDYSGRYPDSVHIIRYRGGELFGSYPLDKFTRFELGTIGYWSDNFLVNFSNERYNYTKSKIFLLSEAFVFDNTIWTDWGPVKGIRTRLETYQTLPFSDYKFYTTYLDFRNYFRLSKRYTLANWLFGISSFGLNPELFYLGGENIRGYDYGEFYYQPSNKVVLGIIELRHPFIDRLKIAYPIPIDIKNIRGVTFFDAGIAFNDPVVIYRSDSGFEDLKLGFGAGLRVQISYFILRFDFAKPLSQTPNRNWKFYFSIGTDF
ncbi:MAG: BamA/TamA family outer membrane protein [candidate division WOR-3 bacterium]|nr:BamA/TamA family outer membrane protein [candidate division WOR-3 bacterium]